MKADHSYITQEMFDTKLEEIVEQEPAGVLLCVPGVHEALSEYYNNQVLTAIDADHGRNGEG